MLSMTGISKRYGSVQANRDVDIEVGPGQILGLLGENGSGKSTLMNVLFGIVRADAGTILFKGQTLSGHGPREALAVGLGMIHQHFKLVDAMSVLDNVMLGMRSGALLRPKTAREQIERARQTYGLMIDPDIRVENLSFGQRQRVEITKAIILGAELLILDEPTSNLSPPEVQELLAFMRRFRESGRSIIFITHKLDEVLDVCDNVVVMRDGEVAGRSLVAGATRADLARMMVGRDVTAPLERSQQKPGAILLETVGLSVRSAGRVSLSGINLRLRAGEVLGIAGIDGNGQSEFADLLAGLHPPEAGTVRLAGKDMTDCGVGERLAAGLSYIPVDRARTSLVPLMTISDNLALREFAVSPFSSHGWLWLKAMRDHAVASIAAFNIKADGPDKAARTLSGGNQQKIVLARELGRNPQVLVAHQPTWGLDPGATRFIVEQILAMRARGGAVLYLASSLEEVLLVSDRVAVIHEGWLSEPVARDDIDLTAIGLLMAGIGFEPAVEKAA